MIRSVESALCLGKGIIDDRIAAQAEHEIRPKFKVATVHRMRMVNGRDMKHGRAGMQRCNCEQFQQWQRVCYQCGSWEV